ncbi:bifunctional glutathionylspermidine amidase/glutathionylspermidine synthetase [Achlya hypogyna]|uniref:Bifunctional glutathionylspermidine amidase/glutathionylspermidine synthetase n=1 Tax=Achlya hypogyna TaxID=1202772 RepID=A0A1V9ZRN0_ACHHY|nr:bifunctional glutathionylspermidine amidase/glutathionylspermidine synthetase [Achlya hypogyna]
MASAPFGSILGVTDGGVAVHCCDYETLGPDALADRDDFKHSVGGVTTGYKWQCVELGRRYLLVNYGVVYDNIAMAYDIFRLKYVRRVSDNALFPLRPHTNGQATTLPAKGSLLIWNPEGKFETTGHIAVVVTATETHVDIVEQNVDFTMWPAGQTYSRRLQVATDPETGAYKLQCTIDGSILGWTTVDMSVKYNYEDVPRATPTDLTHHVVTLSADAVATPWVDASLPFVQTFLQQADWQPSAGPSDYFCMTAHGQRALEYATDHLHHMFLDATDWVLHHEKELGAHFRIPSALWPRLWHSWINAKPDFIAGRFDMTLTADGLKVYEYNADSASCLMECGYNQDAWATLAGLNTVGRSGSDALFTKLVTTWQARRVEGPLHLLCDNNPEEICHAQYMAAAAAAAGLTTHVVVGLGALRRGAGNDLVDADGVVLRNVWKTWAWRTALNELSDDEWTAFLATDEKDARGWVSPRHGRHGGADLKLVDVLLSPSIRVFEPLWTLIPSSKAILPVLNQLYPKHPLLLTSSFELSPALQQSGYAVKPVAGRAGANISIVDATGSVLSQSEGRWADDTPVYQELALLPKHNGKYVQLGTWAIGGEHGGTIIRADTSKIMGLDSYVYALRVVN